METFRGVTGACILVFSATLCMLIAGIGPLPILAMIGVLNLIALSWISHKVMWVLLLLGIFSNGLSIGLGSVTLYAEHLVVPLLIISYVRQRPNLLVSGMRGVSSTIVCFLVWLLVMFVSSSLFAPEPVRSYYVIAMLTISMSTLAWTQSDIEMRIWRVRAGIVLLALISIFSIGAWLFAQFGNIESIFVVQNPGESIYRVKALAFEPNMMGGLCSLWIGLAFYWRKSLSGKLLVATIVPMSFVVALSLTRAAWVALALIAIVALFAGKYTSRRVPLVFLVAMIAGCLVALVGLLSGPIGRVISEKSIDLFEFGEGTGAYRLVTWELALSELDGVGDWLIGLGANTFSQRNDSFITSTGEAYLGNFWVSVIYDSGVVGLFFVAIGFYILFMTTARKFEASLVFATVVLTASTTSPMWFAYPWIALALLEREERISPVKIDTGLESPGLNGSRRLVRGEV